MNIVGYGKKDDYCMTVDRLNPERGYVKDNMVLCLSIINRMKQNLTLEELLSWCNVLISRKEG
jgi:hypothetical protein